MKIIAFDLGKHFAWAHNAPYTCGYVELQGVRAHRFCQLMNYLLKLKELRTAEVAIFECPFARGRDATRSLWGYAGVIEACATKLGLPVLDAATPTIKAFAANHGKAPKNDMMKAAKTMGYRGSNEHEADAWCLLKFAESTLERVT